MIHALHVHSGNLFGGVERMLQVLSPALAGVDPVRSDFALCHDGAVARTLRGAHADVHLLGAVRARRPDEIRRGRAALRRILEEIGPDVAIVHSSWSQAIFGPSVLRRGVPLVRWLHAPQPGPRLLEAWAARSRPALVICNSRYTRDACSDRFPGARLVVQHPPALQHPPTRSRQDVRAELGTPPDAIVVVLASRLEAGKGHLRLLEALLESRSDRWIAWIVGGVQRAEERPLLKAMQELVHRAGLARRVHFLGQRDDVATLLAAADLYCQPNVAPDSFGLSFVEALSAGLPVITTRIGAAPEILDAGCGMLVEPDSRGALAAALSRLIEDDAERQRQGVEARMRARAFCDLPRSLATLASHLASVATPTLTHA